MPWCQKFVDMLDQNQSMLLIVVGLTLMVIGFVPQTSNTVGTVGSYAFLIAGVVLMALSVVQLQTA